MNPLRQMILSALLLLSLAAPMRMAARTPWIDKVPANDHERTNPMAGSAEAQAAGGLLYADHCSKCHGEDAMGKGKRPSLRSERVQDSATPGDLHWLLVNGSLGRGMPSWSKLPDEQIWQIISYVKSLKTK
jgi:mono/diheme cytochrome c family protein